MELSNVSLKRGKQLILDNISGTIPCHKITVLIGESGAGKTTLLRIIAGLEKPTAGTCTRTNDESVGMVFQQFHLFPHMTVLEQVVQPLYVACGIEHGIAYERARKALEAVGLSVYRDRYPHELSGGQQQRVAITRALALQPTLLILDEPTSGLDLVTRNQLITLLKQLRDQSKISIVMTTHDMHCAEIIADYLWVMHNGKIIRMDKRV